MAKPPGIRTGPVPAAQGLCLTTLRNLTSVLGEMATDLSSEHALFCFSYRPANTEQPAVTMLLEKLAEGAMLGGLRCGLVALSGDDVLCLCAECGPGAAVKFARLVRTRVQVSGEDVGFSPGILSVGVVTLRRPLASPRALIRRAITACRTAERKGYGTIEIWRGPTEGVLADRKK